MSLPVLADLEKTNRAKDYAVIGELARRIEDLRVQALHSRSARDLSHLLGRHPEAVHAAARERPLLSRIGEGGEVLERLLDEERRAPSRDEFLSEEDPDLENLSDEELERYWRL